MQKIVSRYALAAHLAIMAVAPLFLLPFAGEHATAIVMLWLAAFGLIWVLMEPSRRRDEMLHEARRRVVSAMLHDPIFWLSLVLVVYAGIRASNGGIGLAYNAELMAWSIRDPALPLLPGSTDGVGLLPFAAVLTLAIIIQGTQHAIGRSARAAFLFVTSFLSSIAAIVLAFSVSYRYQDVLSLLHTTQMSPSGFGMAFGLTLLCALVALFAVVRNGWVKAEPLATIGLIGNAIGVTLFATPLTLAVFVGAFLVVAIIAFVLDRRSLEGSGSFRCALAVIMAIGAPVLYALAEPAMVEKVRAIRACEFFPDGFHAVRAALSQIAAKTWRANPWLGTGIGSFHLDIRFSATAADWAVVSPIQKNSLNGWWQLLAERGVIGTGLIAVTLGMLLWSYGSRLVYSWRRVRFTSEQVLGLVCCAVLVALAFFDCSYLRPEVLLLAGAFLSFSGGAIPERTQDVSEEKDK